MFHKTFTSRFQEIPSRQTTDSPNWALTCNKVAAVLVQQPLQAALNAEVDWLELGSFSVGSLTLHNRRMGINDQ